MSYHSYLVTCPAGFESEVGRLIPGEWEGATVSLVSGGAVWIRLRKPLRPESIPDYVSNVFYVLREWHTSSNPFSELVKQGARKSGLRELPQAYANGRFRVRFSRENRFESVDRGVSNAAERFIADATGSSPDRDGSGHEYWFIIRSETWSAFALRLEREKRDGRIPERGELSPALASLVTLRATRDIEPASVLDPCAGHGAIPDRVSAFFPSARVYARDIDPTAVNFLKNRFADNPHISVGAGDLRELTGITDGSIDLVITDPPWGMWEEGGYRDPGALVALYGELLRSAARVLVASGRLCVLTGAKRDFEAAVAACSRFAGCAGAEGWKTDILVNGKKAALYVLDA